MVNFSQPTGNDNVQDNDWKTVQNKRNNHDQVRNDNENSNLFKTKVTITLRVPKDKPADFSAAEIHLSTIKELCKQDENLITLDHAGNNQINIHKAFGDEKYKEWFKPREKKFASGGGQISVAHYVLSEVKSFNKTLMYTFLKKNNVYIYFNQREGLEHFSAIGVLFGPHPDYSWRQDTIDSVEMTIKAELTPEEKEKLTKNSKAQVVVQLTPQPINNSKFSKVTSVALEVRVPAEHARIYTKVFDRLNERASLLNKGEVDIILDPKVGTFFPYYAKSERPQLFERLMRKQNSDMSSSSVIPVFGLTENASNTIVEDQNGKQLTVSEAILAHPNIRKIEKTASSAELGKFLLIIDRYMKDQIENYVDSVFELVPELENQPASFKKPQRGGNAFRKARINNINNFLTKLEQDIDGENLMYADDDEDTTPPPRPKRFTVSYAQAAKILPPQLPNLSQNPPASQVTTNTTTTATSTITQESLEEALQRFRQETNDTIASFKNDIRNEITSIEDRITTAMLNVLRNTPREITTVNETSENSACTKESQQTISTLVDKVDSLADSVALLAKSVETLQCENNQKRNRFSASPKSPDTEMPDADSSSPPSKQQRARAPSPTLPRPPKGHPLQKITDGAREES
jgi:DNA-directed RNA polymerase subunit F